MDLFTRIAKANYTRNSFGAGGYHAEEMAKRAKNPADEAEPMLRRMASELGMEVDEEQLELFRQYCDTPVGRSAWDEEEGEMITIFARLKVRWDKLSEKTRTAVKWVAAGAFAMGVIAIIV